MSKLRKKSILFICTHNSARSQMAEELVNRNLAGDYEARSAGTKPRGVHPMAVKVMAEIGIDISNQTSKHLDEFKGQEFDYVVTLCSDAEDICPFFPGKEHSHQGFQDPRQQRATRRRGWKHSVAPAMRFAPGLKQLSKADSPDPVEVNISLKIWLSEEMRYYLQALQLAYKSANK